MKYCCVHPTGSVLLYVMIIDTSLTVQTLTATLLPFFSSLLEKGDEGVWTARLSLYMCVPLVAWNVTQCTVIRFQTPRRGSMIFMHVYCQS